MQVSLAYGRGRLELQVPDQADVIAPRDPPGLADERTAFQAAVRRPIGAAPLHTLARPGERVALVIADITRPSPSERLVPWILAELAHVPRSNIVIINGTGSHRPNTPEELKRMLGEQVVDSVRVVNHGASDRAGLALLGRTSSGGEVWLNRAYLEADVRIVTGFIEPHVFAGFSGGPKGVVPALAGMRTIMHLHGQRMVADPCATWGRLEDNPLQAAIREAAAMAPPHFLVNVTLNPQRQITGMWAGHYLQAFEEGCRFAAAQAMHAAPEPYDIVLTSGGGYPADQQLNQAVKAMSAASQIVRTGGAILLAAECSRGIPAGSGYIELLQAAGSPQGLLEMLAAPGFERYEQWAAQTQALVQRKAQVYVASSLPPGAVRSALLEPVESLQEALDAVLNQYGRKARLAVMPEGPQVVPYLALAQPQTPPMPPPLG